MEIVNQNKVNVTQERLDEMKSEKQANIQVLSDIQKEREALRQERNSFYTYKQECESKINEDRLAVKREQENLQNHKNNMS